MSKHTFIKICGLRDAEMALHAVDAGADAIGVVLYPHSSRHVDIATARAIADAVRGRAQVVALMVNASMDEIAGVVGQVAPDILQLHGDETASFVAEVAARFSLPVWRATRVSPKVDLLNFAREFQCATRLLLDADTSSGAVQQYGGTGHTFDWNLIPASLRREIVLSGGLSAENVGSAIKLLAPWGVDVSSGVESSRGVKSSHRIIEFIAAVRGCEQVQTLEKAERHA